MELTYRFEPRCARSLGVTRPPDLRVPIDREPWRDAPAVGDLWNMLRRGKRAEDATDIRICHTPDALYIACRCSASDVVAHDGIREGDLSRDRRGRRDWVEILVDGRHDHRHAVRFKLDVDGKLQAWRIHQGRGEVPNHIEACEEEIPCGDLKSCVRVGQFGWEATVELPFAVIDPDGDGHRPVIGFDFERVRTALPRRHWRWAPGLAAFANTPLEYGDLYLTPGDRTVTAIDLGEVVYEGSPLRLTVESAETMAVQLELLSRVVVPRDDDVYDEQRVTGTLSGSDGRTSCVDLCSSYRLSHRGRWPIEHDYAQRLELELTEPASGQTVFSCSLPFAFDLFIKPGEVYGEAAKPGAPTSEGGDFVLNTRRRIAARIPRFLRLTTRDGASSDAVLRSADGHWEIDLMATGAMQRMAGMIETLFDTEEDRLIATVLFLHQRTVTRHIQSNSDMFPMSPLSTIRMGGAICQMRAEALCGLVTQMTSPRTGQPYHARIVALRGHSVAGVADAEDAPDQDLTVLDPDVGLFFYLPDNSRLATVGDLERDPSIAYRSNSYNVRYGVEIWSDEPTHFTHDWARHGEWPAGAPEW